MSKKALHRFHFLCRITVGILIMGSALVFGISILVSFFPFAQELTPVVSVVNVEIPVRVFKGDKFIDNLTINDFEVYEDGKPQSIKAIYLIKKADINREAGKKEIKLRSSRLFVFRFEMTESLPETGKVTDYFIDHVILSDDSFEVVTPVKAYRMRSDVFEIFPKETVKNQMKEILRGLIQRLYEAERRAINIEGG